jgi:hypothetical protein
VEVQSPIGDGVGPPGLLGADKRMVRREPASLTYSDWHMNQIQINGKLVSAEELLDQVFDKSCKPSIRWLRTQTKAKAIPFVRIGHLIFFDVEMVKSALAAKNLVKGRYSLAPAQPQQ